MQITTESPQLVSYPVVANLWHLCCSRPFATAAENWATVVFSKLKPQCSGLTALLVLCDKFWVVVWALVSKTFAVTAVGQGSMSWDTLTQALGGSGHEFCSMFILPTSDYEEVTFVVGAKCLFVLDLLLKPLD